MSIKAYISRVMRGQLGAHAAWLPITNTFALGDFGVVDGGVFNRLGNLRDYTVPFEATAGPPATVNYTSASATTVRTVANATVDVLPDAPLEARVEIAFENAKSLMIKAKTVEVEEMTNVLAVANALARRKGWRSRYRVVHKLYTGTNVLLVSTKTAGTKVVLSGDAAALKKLNVGDLSASVHVGASKELGLEVTGMSGPIALGLFRVGRSDPVFLAEGGEARVEYASPDDDLSDDL